MFDMEAIKNFSIDKSDWKKVKFGGVVFEPKESVKDPVTEGIEHVVGLEHIDSEDMHLRRSASIEGSTTFTKKFSKDDVLFGRRRAYLKKAAKADFDGICSGDITVMRADNNLLLPQLLPFIVNNDRFFDYAIKHSAGGLSPRVKFKDLKDYELLLPNKKEQESLLNLLSAIDEMHESYLTSIDKKEILKNSVLSELFSCAESEAKKVIAGINVSSFKMTKFSEICLESMFGPRFSSKLYDERGNIASLRTTDIDESGDISLSTMPKASIENNKFKEHHLLPGDIVISRSGTIGLTAVFEGYDLPVIPAAFLIRFRLSKDVNPHYIKLFFNSKVGRTYTSKISSGAVQKNITSKAVLDLNIPLPDKVTQDLIVDLDNRLNKKSCSRHYKNTISIKKALINKVF